MVHIANNNFVYAEVTNQLSIILQGTLAASRPPQKRKEAAEERQKRRGGGRGTGGRVYLLPRLDCKANITSNNRKKRHRREQETPPRTRKSHPGAKKGQGAGTKNTSTGDSRVPPELGCLPCRRNAGRGGAKVPPKEQKSGPKPYFFKIWEGT